MKRLQEILGRNQIKSSGHGRCKVPFASSGFLAGSAIDPVPVIDSKRATEKENVLDKEAVLHTRSKLDFVVLY